MVAVPDWAALFSAPSSSTKVLCANQPVSRVDASRQFDLCTGNDLNCSRPAARAFSWGVTTNAAAAPPSTARRCTETGCSADAA